MEFLPRERSHPVAAGPVNRLNLAEDIAPHKLMTGSSYRKSPHCRFRATLSKSKAKTIP
jgi:hypothetical protein